MTKDKRIFIKNIYYMLSYAFAILRQSTYEEIEKEPLAKIDYVKIVDLSTMQQIDTIEHGILAAMAVYIGKTRLIDNFMIED